MITSETKNISEILQLLSSYKKILLVGCGECATICRVGGISDLPVLAKTLEANGKIITGWFVPKQSCQLLKTKLELKSISKLISESDAILSMSCGSGAQTLVEILPDLPILPGSNTMFLSSQERVGDFHMQCSMCGDCILGITGGICPQSKCAKSLMNGPCSGSVDGKCETYRERDCAWHLIYNRLKKFNKLNDFQVQLPFKNHLTRYNKVAIKVEPKNIIKKGEGENEKKTFVN